MYNTQSIIVGNISHNLNVTKDETKNNYKKKTFQM